jgi:DDE superfamily endonuclease
MAAVELEDAKMRSTCMACMFANTEMFLGIQPTSYPFMHKLASKTELPLTDVCLTVWKIRMNEDWDIMGELFGYSGDKVCKVFMNTLPKLVPHLNAWIHWAASDNVRYEVPEVFKKCNLDDVQAILWCLHVADTKYLVSYNPSGAVTYISEGYPGKTSGNELVASSGYIYTIPENCKIMVSENLEQLECLTGLKNCTVVRVPDIPPRTPNPTKEHLDTARNIVRLRVHVNQMVIRIQHFRLCVSETEGLPVEIMNSVMVIAAGLSNL